MIIASVDGLPELTNGRQEVWNGELPNHCFAMEQSLRID